MNHFGIETKPEEKLTKQAYLNYPIKGNLFVSLEDVQYNYDKNMAYFKNLSKPKFQSELGRFLSKFNKFKEITNLNECDCFGFYLMVLDEYNQVYIGVADNIKKRIIQHWSKKPVHLIYSNKETSKLCIDSFKAFDTTRIYILNDESYQHIKDFANKMLKEFHPEVPQIKHISEVMEDDEEKMIAYFDNKYTCNRYTRSNMKGYKRNFQDVD